MRKIFLSFSMLSLLLVITACSESNTSSINVRDQNKAIINQGKNLNSSSYKSIRAEELNTMLENKDFTLLDVHIPEQKHIANTDLFIPYDEIKDNLGKLPLNKNAKIVVYCRSGGMSKIASTFLAKEGYTNIIDLEGGKRAYDKYLKTKLKTSEIKASEKVGYIEFEAKVISENNLEDINKETEGNLTASIITPGETKIFLSMNNHRDNLEKFEFKRISKLDGLQASNWEQISSGMGGHHVSGILTFDNKSTPNILNISGLSVGEVNLSFKTS